MIIANLRLTAILPGMHTAGEMLVPNDGCTVSIEGGYACWPVKIQQATGPHEHLLTIVKRRKLQWYGHVTRSSGLAKTILQVTVKGGRRQGRQRKQWEDNIREWTGRSSASPRGQWRTGKNGENWLQNHLWCPNDPRG